MTTQEFNSIKWRLIGHISMSNTHYSVYKGECNGIAIEMQIDIQMLKNGDLGKTRVAYLTGERVFKNRDELIKYLNELITKGDEK